MAVRVRPMTAADKPALMQILRHTPEFRPPEVAVAGEVIDSYLADPRQSGYNILVAADNPGVAGYICYGPTPCTEGTWDIYWTAVSGEKRGQGIGTALMRAGEAAIGRASGRLIIIETSSIPVYEATRRFYRRCGYEEIGRIPDFYAPGDDKITMQKRPGQE